MISRFAYTIIQAFVDECLVAPSPYRATSLDEGELGESPSSGEKTGYAYVKIVNLGSRDSA